MFKKIHKYSSYACSIEIKRMFEKIYKDILFGTLKISIQYRFETTIFGNENLLIYTDRPGILVGKGGINIDALRAEYRKINKHCKDVYVYESTFLNLN